MRGIGVIEDGFAFTEAELARGRPRFWWHARKAAAYERVVAQRRSAGQAQDATRGGKEHGHRAPAAGAVAAMADAAGRSAMDAAPGGASGGSGE